MIIEDISNIQSSIHIYRQSVKSQERTSTLWESRAPVRRPCWLWAVRRWPPAPSGPAGRWLWCRGRRSSRPRRRHCGRAARWGTVWETRRGRRRRGPRGPERVRPVLANVPRLAPRTRTGPPELLRAGTTDDIRKGKEVRKGKER